jgi:hypothetical protein
MKEKLKKRRRKRKMQRMTQYKEKICNICGEDCLVYTVDRNAIICKDCKPIEKKKIPSEAKMLQKILGVEK